jgi:hypothetical protein
VASTARSMTFSRLVFSDSSTAEHWPTQEVLGVDFILAHGDAASLYETATS